VFAPKVVLLKTGHNGEMFKCLKNTQGALLSQLALSAIDEEVEYVQASITNAAFL